MFSIARNRVNSPSKHTISSARLCHLLHSCYAGVARHPATLDDHANLAHAALALYECTGEVQYWQDAESFVDEIEQHYKDENGAHFSAANDTPSLITRTKTVSDSATPSGNGTLVGVLARLYYLTGAERYRALADNVVRTFDSEPTRNFFPLSTLINLSKLLRREQQAVIVGNRNDAETQSMVDCVHSRSLPDRIFNIVATPDDLPVGHSAEN